MKKLIITTAFICAAFASYSASFKWSASNIANTDNTGSYNGNATLQALLNSVWTDVHTATVTDGAIKLSTTEFSDSVFVADTVYDFRFVITDGDKEFMSGQKTVPAQLADTASIKFGSQADVKWTGNVPEPTSGLLLLLGMAGLALRRKHA